MLQKFYYFAYFAKAINTSMTSNNLFFKQSRSPLKLCFKIDHKDIQYFLYDATIFVKICL